MVREQYLEVKQTVTCACEQSGRNGEACTLIAVSKTKPVEMLKKIKFKSCWISMISFLPTFVGI